MDIKYSLQKNDSVGRYYTASTDLKAGEIIFQEEPFSIGPKSGCPLTCLGCHKYLELLTVCDKCGWPVCDSNCSKEEVHSKNECIVFSSVRVKFNIECDPSAQLECITVLRTLLESERDPTRWLTEVSLMEAHNENRKARTETWSVEQINVVIFLHDKCKLGSRFNKEKIQTVCGILEVNCFEVITNDHYAIRGLYPKLGILSHNCIANTIHSRMPANYKMILRTTVAVKQNDQLYCSYTRSTDPTLLRRMKLWENKYFNCNCERCSDPTELGTHLNSLKCTKCDSGLIISTNPLDNNASWKCTHCEYAISAAGVQKIYHVIKGEIEELEQIPFASEKLEETEKVLKKYKGFLHPKHSFKINLWHDLIMLYGRAYGYTHEMLPNVMLERKIEMCGYLIDTYNIIEPGLTRLRGLTMYELHMALMFLNRSYFEGKFYNLEKFKEEMRKVADILEESGNILSMEPEGTEESMIGVSALNSVQQLRESIEEVQERPPETIFEDSLEQMQEDLQSLCYQ